MTKDIAERRWCWGSVGLRTLITYEQSDPSLIRKVLIGDAGDHTLHDPGQ